jgi:FkbM family methyltransferase
MLRPPYGISWVDYLRLRTQGPFQKDCIVRGQRISIGARSPLELWRCLTYETKEPETLDWIDSFSKDDVLFDVGANIGLYSLYAGKRGARVYSFEPEGQNFAGLTKNCLSNGLGNVTPYCMALADSEHFDLLYVTSTTPGDSQHNLGARNPYYRRDCRGTQGIFACTLDQLCFEHGFPVPQHIKIDVDGIEERIVEGGQKVLAHPDFRTLMIEISGYDGAEPTIPGRLAALGLRLLSVHAREYRDGSMWARNHVFGREGK